MSPDNLRDFGQLDSVEFDTPVVVLLALVKRAQDRLDKEWMASLPKNSEIDRDTFSRHRRLHAYACKIYDASLCKGREKQAAMLGVAERDLVDENFEEADDGVAHCPRFAVLLDHQSKYVYPAFSCTVHIFFIDVRFFSFRSVVLAVRGTFSLTDVIIDVVCDDEEFLGGHAHRGILRGARAALRRAAPALRRAADANPSYGVCVTGHSLGAATAELVSMMLLFRDDPLAEDVLRKGTQVECVALAPPPVFRTEDRAKLARISDRISIYVNGQDCVPRMSLGSAARLVTALRAVDALPLTGTQKFHLLAASTPGGEGDPVADRAVAALSGKDIDAVELETNLKLLEDTVASATQDR